MVQNFLSLLVLYTTPGPGNKIKSKRRWKTKGPELCQIKLNIPKIVLKNPGNFKLVLAILEKNLTKLLIRRVLQSCGIILPVHSFSAVSAHLPPPRRLHFHRPSLSCRHSCYSRQSSSARGDQGSGREQGSWWSQGRSGKREIQVKSKWRAWHITRWNTCIKYIYAYIYINI